MLNINEDDLKAAIVEKAADQILRNENDLTETVRKEVKQRLDMIFVERAEAQIQAATTLPLPVRLSANTSASPAGANRKARRPAFVRNWKRLSPATGARRLTPKPESRRPATTAASPAPNS